MDQWARALPHDPLAGPQPPPAGVLWGAQTALSLHFFAIGAQRLPLPLIHALAWLKWAAANVNRDLGRLDAARADAIAQAALRVAGGRLDAEFPLSVWQTGSGTQSHMNVNEVLATLAQRALVQDAALLQADPGGRRGAPPLTVHANDHVNLGQSSNDVFPSAVHIAAALALRGRLLPMLQQLQDALGAKAQQFSGLAKVGRTHLQDAAPVSLGQEFGGYAAQLALCRQALQASQPALHALAIGGTAVGTGLNTHPQFGSRVAALLAQQLDLPLVQASNLFAAMAGQEALVALHGALRLLAVALIKIANDIRLMGSGPRAGLAELRLPANEPGSSIMPGKVNPTQVEALVMVCIQVLGHDSAIGFAAASGQFELNVCQPLIALNLLDSLQLLADAMHSFARHCVEGLVANEARLAAGLQASLMLVTALAPHIGYQAAARIAQAADASGSTLREAALAQGTVTAAQFDAWVDVRQMLGPH